jgi:hypothetical protein
METGDLNPISCFGGKRDDHCATAPGHDNRTLNSVSGKKCIEGRVTRLGEILPNELLWAVFEK